MTERPEVEIWPMEDNAGWTLKIGWPSGTTEQHAIPGAGDEFMATICEAFAPDPRLDDLVKALKAVAARQEAVLETLRRHGVVFTDLGRDPSNWQHVAFSIYTELCEMAANAGDAVRAFEGVCADCGHPRAAGGHVGDWGGEPDSEGCRACLAEHRAQPGHPFRSIGPETEDPHV